MDIFAVILAVLLVTALTEFSCYMTILRLQRNVECRDSLPFAKKNSSQEL